MALRSTTLGAILFTVGCAATGGKTGTTTGTTTGPQVQATRPAPVTPPPTEDENAADPAPGTATPGGGAPMTGAAASGTTKTDSKTKIDPFGDVGFKEVNQKSWMAEVRDTIAQKEKVAPADLCFSPGLLHAAFVRSPPVAPPARPGKRVPPRRHEIVVVDNQGRPVASFRPIVASGSDEPPHELRFMSEERLVYEVVARAPAAAPAATKPAAATRKPPAPKSKARHAAHAAGAKRGHEATHAPPAEPPPPTPPPRLFVIQPVAPPPAPRARPIRCQGFDFTFTHEHDRLAFVGGQTGATFVAVDGAQVYPRHGRTVVASAPAWSKDGRRLAFLELPPEHPPRLVLVAEIDDPAGDVSWDLPADTKLDGASVFWAGAGKLVVRKTATRPIFSATFTAER